MSSCLPLATILSNPLMKLITPLADAIGCPIELIFFPLLTIVASCIGINGLIYINETWQEPAVMWFIIAANKGQKKTAALKQLKNPLIDIEAELQEKWQRDMAEDKPTTPPQLCTKHFSFEELHNVMRRNGSQMLGLFDEMSTLYGQLDLYRHSGFVMDRKTLITLNGGSSWSRNYRNYSAMMKKQLSTSVASFNHSWWKRGSSRMMLMDLMTASCSVSHHREMCSDCDAIVVLEQAVQSVTLSGGDSTPPTPHQWSTTVTSEAVLGTSQIVDYLCTQKFTMMDLKEVLPNDPRPDDFDDIVCVGAGRTKTLSGGDSPPHQRFEFTDSAL